MRLVTLRNIVVAAVVAVVTACADSPAAPQLDPSMANASHCSATLSSLLDQARAIYGPRASDFNSVRGKLNNLDQQLRRGRTETAQSRAHDIVDFTLAQRDEGRLSGTDAQITAFINAVYCFAGIDIVIGTPEDTWFILPSDQPQVLYGLDSSVGISLPGFPVTEPSLLQVERFDGLLNTKLDQYPGFVRITLTNAGGSGLAGRATITVCATDVADPAVAARLRLGHGIRDTGFVLTPEPTEADPAPANVLCEEPTTTTGLFSRFMGAVRETFAPRTLEASSASTMRRFGGGVSGTVTEFSPFAPVDPVLSFGGGVSGTVTEFSRGALMAMEGIETVTVPPCSTAPVGTDLPADCQPLVTVKTFNGTLLEQVPVDWAVLSDGLGRIAPRTGNLDAISCGDFGSSAATTTSANGNAGVCWRLGGVGLNRVVARARAGGDAPLGVVFDNAGADSAVFEVNVTAVTLKIEAGNGLELPAGSTTEAVVKAKDASGAPLAGVEVLWTAVGGSVDAMSAVTGADGLARVNWTLAEGQNQLAATVRNAPNSTVTFASEGTVAGPPSQIVIVSGNAQTGPAGTPLPLPLVVRVKDANGTPVSGATVKWELREGSGTLSATQVLTDAQGLASITFTPGVGQSRVKALIDSYVFKYVYFTPLTGVAP